MNPSSLPASFPWLSVLIWTPLAGAALLALLRTDRAVRWWTLGVTLVIAAAVVPVLLGFNPAAPGFQFVEDRPWILPLGLGYRLGVDGLSLVLVLLTVWLMPLCVLASWSSITTRVRQFMTALLMMETAMLGVFCALDLVLLFLFWEAMLIPMGLLIGVWGGPRRVYAAVKFILYTVAGSMGLLVAIVALYLHSGTLDLRALLGRAYPLAFQLGVFAALFLCFAIKVPMVPFHTWLPAAHVEAPTAGSVLLASVLLKMGTYGFVRLSLPISPEASRLLAPYMSWLSVAAILYGGLTALAQTDLKRLVAYSSIAHMGFATLGIFTLTQAGLQGAILQMVNHGIATGALFIAVGMVYERLHTRELTAAAGLGKHMPVFAGFFGVFALASMAFPSTNNFISEFLALAGAFQYSKPIALAAVPGVVLAAAYCLRMLQKVAYGSPQNPDHSGVADLNLREVVTLAPLLVLVFWIGLKPGPVVRLFEPVVRQLLEQISPSSAPALPVGMFQGPVWPVS
jgi:NADH-quinone oxidoreductase subunit M